MNDTEIIDEVRAFILQEILPGEDASELNESTPLITTGIIDSIAVLKLVMFLEERFKISLAPHETSPEYMNTLGRIAELARAKLGAGGGPV